MRCHDKDKEYVMTPAEFLEARKKLGFTVIGVSNRLKVNRRTVYLWQSGAIAIPGPVEVAIQLLLENRKRENSTPE